MPVDGGVSLHARVATFVYSGRKPPVKGARSWNSIMRLRGISLDGGLGGILGGLAIAFVLAGPGAASAQGTAAQQVACTPDVFRLCSSHIPDVESIIACLRGNGPRLSAPCHEVLFARPKVTRPPSKQ
jgi:hypothetical protein